MIDKNLRKEEEKRKWNIENKQVENAPAITPQAQSAGLNYASQLAQSSGGGSNAMSGALQGAAIGSVVPGIGTAVGAGVGGLAGGLQAMADKKRRKQEIQAQVQMQLAGIEQGKADRIANAMFSLQNSFAQSLSNRGNVRL